MKLVDQICFQPRHWYVGTRHVPAIRFVTDVAEWLIRVTAMTVRDCHISSRRDPSAPEYGPAWMGSELGTYPGNGWHPMIYPNITSVYQYK